MFTSFNVSEMKSRVKKEIYIVWAPPNFRKLLRRRRSAMPRTPGAPGVLVRRTAALRAGITGSRK